MHPFINSVQQQSKPFLLNEYHNFVTLNLYMIMNHQLHMMEELKQFRQVLKDAQKASETPTLSQRHGHSRQNQIVMFQKNKICHVPDCGKRYSSRIALRTHIRNKHNPETLKLEKSWRNAR